MTRCSDATRGEPLEAMGYGADEVALLRVARHYCASFAQPEQQGWIAAIGTALSHFGDDRGPEAAVAVLTVLQTVRRIRRSGFRFNSADCPCCSTYVTGHECLLMSALRATRRGQPDAAHAHAILLCEGNEAQPVVRALAVLADRILGAPQLGPVTASAMPAPAAGV